MTDVTDIMETIASVIEALDRAPSIVIPLVHEVPANLLKRRPTPRKWSVHEHACHLAQVDRLYSKRLDQFLTEPDPIITPYDPARDEADNVFLQMELQSSLEQFARDRKALVKRLRRLAADAWLKTAKHGDYSHYSVFIMFRHVALHDLFHAYRIEELLLKKDWASERFGAAPDET